MEEAIKDAVEVIHASPTKAVLYVAGGASHASSWLLSVPGASSTVLESRVPYERSAFVDAIGEKAATSLTSYASHGAARALAKAAYQRAVKFAPPGVRVCGVAAACALAAVNPKKGDHRAFVVTHSWNRVAEYELTLMKGKRSRWEEDLVSSRLVVQALLDDCGGSVEISLKDKLAPSKSAESLTLSRESSMSLVREVLFDGDKLSGPKVQEHVDPIEALLSGHVNFVECRAGLFNRDATSATLIFPGSFNPIHIGHRKLMEAARGLYPADKTAFEISATNPDKPPLEPEVIRTRLAQFRTEETVLITSAPLFSIKADLFRDTKFVVGVDTALRIVDPKYYGGDAGLISALLDLRVRGCKFLVAGRLDQRDEASRASHFLTLGDVKIPPGFAEMFEAIPEELFRVDLSSSELRQGRKL